LTKPKLHHQDELTRWVCWPLGDRDRCRARCSNPESERFETVCLHPFLGARARALLFVTTHETEFANMLSAARNCYSTDKGTASRGWRSAQANLCLLPGPQYGREHVKISIMLYYTRHQVRGLSKKKERCLSCAKGEQSGVSVMGPADNKND
jgi:hypothetical protein